MVKNQKLQDYRKLAKTTHWFHRKRYPLTEEQKYWLRGNQSLTKQLIKKSDNHFEVIVLKEAFARPYLHEAIKLGLSLHKVAKIREVELRCDNEPSVYARSVIPLDVFKDSGLQLANLGNTPLGHLLFKRAKVNLDTREIAKRNFVGKQRWARRTLYCFNRQNILVSEFFLF